MLPHLDTLFRFRANQYLLSPKCCMLSGEATDTNLQSGLTRPGLEPTIYHTRGEHANHCTIDAVKKYCMKEVVKFI